MGRTNEFTLVAKEGFAGELGCAVAVDATLVHNTPVGVVAGAGEAIDGIVTDITPGKPNKVLAVAKIGDIVFGLIGEAITVADELAVGENGKLVKATEDAVVVAKALATGKAGERIAVIIK